MSQSVDTKIAPWPPLLRFVLCWKEIILYHMLSEQV